VLQHLLVFFFGCSALAVYGASDRSPKNSLDDGDRRPWSVLAIIWRGQKLDLRLLLARPLTAGAGDEPDRELSWLEPRTATGPLRRPYRSLRSSSVLVAR